MFVEEIKLSKLSVISAENEVMSITDVIHICALLRKLFTNIEKELLG